MVVTISCHVTLSRFQPWFVSPFFGRLSNSYSGWILVQHIRQDEKFNQICRFFSIRALKSTENGPIKVVLKMTSTLGTSDITRCVVLGHCCYQQTSVLLLLLWMLLLPFVAILLLVPLTQKYFDNGPCTSILSFGSIFSQTHL